MELVGAEFEHRRQAEGSIHISGQSNSPALRIDGSKTRKTLFVTSVVFTQLCQMIPFGTGLLSGLSISNSLERNDQHSTQIIDPSDRVVLAAKGAWIAASYPLTSGTFVLIGGRLGAIYGHKMVLVIGCTWWTIWTLCTGFAKGLVALCFMRALSGIGGGLIAPNAVALLGISFPPGPQRSLAFGIFGAMAPVGAAGGSLIAGVIVQLAEFKWVFFFLAMFGATVFIIAALSVPWDSPQDPGGKVDWLGAYLGVAGLITFNFAWNQAPLVGWDQAYVYIILIVSLIHLTAFAAWELRCPTAPILPFTIWSNGSFKALILVVSFAFMGLGIFLWYMTLFMIEITKASLILTGVQFLPLAVLGACAALLAAWMIQRLPAQTVIGVGCAALVTCNVLLALAPPSLTYWAMQFPAITFAAFTADLIYAAAQIVASNAVGQTHQGVAGSLINTLLTYSMSTGLGFAGTVESHTSANGHDILHGYRMAAWLAAALGATALIGAILFIRIEKHDTKEQTV